MTITTTQPPASGVGCESGRRSFEAFLVDGERYIVGGGSDNAGGFAEFFRAVPVDLQMTIAGYFHTRAWHTRAWLSDLKGQDVSTVSDPTAGAVSVAQAGDSTGPADSVVRESKTTPPGRVERIDLFLEELTVDPSPGWRTHRSRESVFLDVMTVDARGEVATTSNRVCLRKQCTPAAFCDRVLATIDIDQAAEGWPRTISFQVDALEGADDRLPGVMEAARRHLRREIAGMLADRGGYETQGGVMASDVARYVDSHAAVWQDCFIAWFTALLPPSPREGREIALGGAQFTATLSGPDLVYTYRNLHTGRLIEVSGHTLVRSRPIVHTFVAPDEELRARFRLGLRGSGKPGELPDVDTRSPALETVGTGFR